MKPHFSKAPAKVQDMVERGATTASLYNGRISEARAWRHRINAYLNRGFRVDPSDLPKPAKTGNNKEQTAEDRVWQRKEAALAAANVQRVAALEAWAQGPSKEELAERHRAEREQAQHERLVAERAEEILATQAQKAQQKAFNQAQKELTA